MEFKVWSLYCKALTGIRYGLIPGCASGFPPNGGQAFHFFIFPSWQLPIAAFPHLKALPQGIKASVFCEGLYGSPFEHKGFFPLRACIASSIPVPSAAPLSPALLLLRAEKQPAEGCQISAVSYAIGISTRLASERLRALCHVCLSSIKWLGAES